MRKRAESRPSPESAWPGDRIGTFRKRGQRTGHLRHEQDVFCDVVEVGPAPGLEGVERRVRETVKDGLQAVRRQDARDISNLASCAQAKDRDANGKGRRTGHPFRTVTGLAGST
jgi:hypothetical protein